MFGIFLLFAGVLILGFETGFDNLHVLPQDSFNTQMSITFGLVASICFALGSVFFKQTSDKFGPDHPGYDFSAMLYDSNLMYGLALLTWMLCINFSFSWIDLALSVASFATVNTGELLAGWSVVYGNAGPVSAIGNLKAMFMTVGVAVVTHESPSILEWTALFLGLVGATIVLLSEKKQDQKSE